MAKIIKFGTISDIDGQINFDGFTIDPEGDESIGKTTSLDEYGSSVYYNPHKVADVILAGVIERLSAMREANSGFILARTSVEHKVDITRDMAVYRYTDPMRTPRDPD